MLPESPFVGCGGSEGSERSHQGGGENEGAEDGCHLESKFGELSCWIVTGRLWSCQSWEK